MVSGVARRIASLTVKDIPESFEYTHRTWDSIIVNDIKFCAFHVSWLDQQIIAVLANSKSFVAHHKSPI